MPSRKHLDDKTRALVALGAAVAVDSPRSMVRLFTDAAIAAGAGIDEVLGVLLAIAPMVGTARIVTATPKVALALGYDIDAALESTDDAGGSVQHPRIEQPGAED